MARIHHPPLYVEVQIRRALERENLSSKVVWTYILARIYQDNLSGLVEKLCGVKEALPANPEIWLEAHLYPTRDREGES